MRKHIARAVIVLVAVLGTSSVARADIIQVGSLIYTELAAGEAPVGFFHITNQTGANVQDDFPIQSFVSFTGMTLTVNGGAANTVPGDFTDTDLVHPGYEFDSKNFLNAMLAHIGGAAPAGPFNVLADASQGIVAGSYILSGDFFLLNGDFTGQPISDFTIGIIAVNGRRVVDAPEPVTMSLLGLGVAGILVRRRMAARS